MLSFLVPPGIGDFSAMYCKLCNMSRPMEIIGAIDAPMRLGPFLDILPGIKNGGYSHHSAPTVLDRTLPPGTDLASLKDGFYYLSINKWLEEGGKIADWIPGKTSYHFEFKNEEYADYARHWIKSSTEPDEILIGVYCSAYGNSRHWGFWDYSGWRRFLTKVHETLPKEKVHYLFIGAEYDLAIGDILHGWMSADKMKSSLLLGDFHIGSTVELIRNMDYFFSFPSGLAFLADVVNTPNTMWLPEFMQKMRYTFIDPANQESKQSFHDLFNSPETAAERFLEVGKTHMERRYEHRTRNNS